MLMSGYIIFQSNDDAEMMIALLQNLGGIRLNTAIKGMLEISRNGGSPALLPFNGTRIDFPPDNYELTEGHLKVIESTPNASGRIFYGQAKNSAGICCVGVIDAGKDRHELDVARFLSASEKASTLLSELNAFHNKKSKVFPAAVRRLVERYVEEAGAGTSPIKVESFAGVVALPDTNNPLDGDNPLDDSCPGVSEEETTPLPQAGKLTQAKIACVSLQKLADDFLTNVDISNNVDIHEWMGSMRSAFNTLEDALTCPAT